MNIKIMMIIVSILYVLALTVGYFDTTEEQRLKNQKGNDFLHKTIEDLDFCEKEEPKREGYQNAVEMYKRWLKKTYFTARKDKNFILDHQSEEGIKKYLGETVLEKDK